MKQKNEELKSNFEAAENAVKQRQEATKDLEKKLKERNLAYEQLYKETQSEKNNLNFKLEENIKELKKTSSSLVCQLELVNDLNNK